MRRLDIGCPRPGDYQAKLSSTTTPNNQFCHCPICPTNLCPLNPASFLLGQ